MMGGPWASLILVTVMALTMNASGMRHDLAYPDMAHPDMVSCPPSPLTTRR